MMWDAESESSTLGSVAMAFKSGSEFRGLLWAFVAVTIISYGSSALGWSSRPSESDLLFGLLFFIFIALVEIGTVLERVAPTKPKDRQDSPP
jgi:hypothetical protein